MVLFVQSVSKLATSPLTSNIRILFKSKQLLLFETSSKDCLKLNLIRFGSTELGYKDDTKTDFTYPVKKIELNVCSNLYKKWKGKQPGYKDAPVDGIKHTIEYADTKDLLVDHNGYNENEDRLPTALLLHGAPGGHRDFIHLTEYLNKRRVRVIAPNFPDYTITLKTNVFRHRNEEKTEYLKDFLNAINIKEIDMMFTHSSAIFPALNIWKDDDSPLIRSLCLFNPAGHRRIQAMRPSWFVDNLCRICINKTSRDMFSKFGTIIFKIGRTKVDPNNFNNAILAAKTMFFSNFHEVEGKLELIKSKKTPLLIVFGDKDRLVEKEIFYEMAKILDFDKNDCFVYSKDGALEKTGKSDDFIKIACFKNCGHYTFIKQADYVNTLVGEFVDKYVDLRKAEIQIKKYKQEENKMEMRI